MLHVPRPLAALAAATVLALGAAACGDEKTVTQSDESTSAVETTASTPAETTTTDAAEAPSSAGAVLPISSDTKKKPKIPKPSGDPPTKLVVKDIVEGKGPAIKAGQTATVQYVGVSWSTGQEFDASWDRGEPFPFPLGGGQVIPGWDKGVEGMKAGGRRELVIPPDLAYGPQGSPPAIGPNETLVFVVDLTKIS
jgi:peptidylprolyl isomerase